MPKLKVCGTTSLGFALEAASRGVDYLGVIFAERSPRRIGLEAAAEIASKLRGPRLIGVFAGNAIDEIESIAKRVPLDVIQLHGGYGAEAVARLKAAGLEVWRLYDGTFAGEDATLLDGRDGARCGGTGRLADWALVADLKRAGRRVVLAGGISADNIAEAVATGADVIDANSSLETAPGVKSVERLDALLERFRESTKTN